MKTHLFEGSALMSVAILAMFLFIASSEAVPPKYKVTEKQVIIEGVSPDNPVVYDNDWWTDIPDAAYIWAKASLGKCDLRGNIITRCTFGWKTGYAHRLEDQVKDCDKLLKAARASGLKNIPDPVVGAKEALRKPASGLAEDTKHVPSPGSDLIVAQARKASVGKPLLIFCGGSCTTIATAYLTDTSIADKVIVFQVDGGAYNGSDAWAWQIAMKHFRFVNWARGYFWKEVSNWEPKLFEKLPANALGNLLRNYAKSDLGKANQWGDGAWVYDLFDRHCITQAEAYGKSAITVPKAGTNAQRMRKEFFNTMANSSVYHNK